MACFVPSWAQPEKSSCPPPCKSLSAYIFNDRFCCKKTKNTEIDCKVYAWIEQQNNSKTSVTCDRYQEVDVSYYDSAFYRPVDPLKLAYRDLKNSPCHKEEICKVYQCPNRNVSMALFYNLDIATFAVHLYHPDSYTFLALDSYLPFNLDRRSEMVQETIRNLQTYLCYSFDPKQFLNTQQAIPFAFPKRRDETDKPGVQTNASHKKAATQTLAKAEPEPTKPTAQTALSVTPSSTSNISSAAPLPAAAAFRLANIVFYPANSPVQNIRRFESADKKIELKVLFKSGDKTSFYKQLKNDFSNFRTRQTDCPNNNVLLEFLSNTSYKAFLLHTSAILTWEEPAYNAALQDTPAENQKRQELCTISPIQFWK